MGGRWRSNVDRVLTARGKMMKNKANGPSEMQELPIESLDEITHLFGTRFRGESRALAALTTLRWRKGVRGGGGGWAIALMSVLAEWYAAVIVGLLQEEPELIEWKELHVGGGEGGGQLRAHAGMIDKSIAKTLGVAGGSVRCVGSGVLQVSDCVRGELGRVDGLRRGQIVRGVKDTDIHCDP